MSNDKNSIGVDISHPDFTPKTGLDFFSNHEATKNYRSAFQELDELNEITFFHIFKTFILSSIDITIKSKNIPKQIETQDNIDELIYCIRKFHIIDDDIIDLVELTLILKIFSLKQDEEINHLQEAIERKFLPKKPASENKKKASSYHRFAATYFAVLLGEAGASKKQAIALSCELFGFGESFVKNIYSDVLEAKNHSKLNHYLPMSDLIDGLIFFFLNEKREKLSYLMQEFQNSNLKGNMATAKYKTITCTINMLIEKGSVAYKKISIKEREAIQKLFPNEFSEHITNQPPSLDDSINDLILKNYALYGALVMKHFNLTA